MYKHEKQAVERLQSNHIHMLSTLSTAIIASFFDYLIIGNDVVSHDGVCR